MIDGEADNRIVERAVKLSHTSRPGFRLVHLRTIIRLAQDQYDRELAEWGALNVVHADPVTESAYGEPIP